MNDGGSASACFDELQKDTVCEKHQHFEVSSKKHKWLNEGITELVNVFNCYSILYIRESG